MQSQKERIINSSHSLHVQSRDGVDYIRGSGGTLIRITPRLGKNTKRRCIV